MLRFLCLWCALVRCVLCENAVCIVFVSCLLSLLLWSLARFVLCVVCLLICVSFVFFFLLCCFLFLFFILFIFLRAHCFRARTARALVMLCACVSAPSRCVCVSHVCAREWVFRLCLFYFLFFVFIFVFYFDLLFCLLLFY